jgi:hypothetical protein
MVAKVSLLRSFCKQGIASFSCMLASSQLASARVCSLTSSRVSWCTVPSVFKFASPRLFQLASCECSNLAGASSTRRPAVLGRS